MQGGTDASASGAEVQPLEKRNRIKVGRTWITDVKAKRTTEYVALLDTDMLDALVKSLVAGMHEQGVPHSAFMDGLLVIVSRPEGATT